MNELQQFSGMSFGLGTTISLMSGMAGAIGVWFRLKGIVNIQEVELGNLKTEIMDIKTDYKEDKKSIHKRLEMQREAIDTNKEHTDEKMSDMKQFINDMKIEIIKEIHNK